MKIENGSFVITADDLSQLTPAAQAALAYQSQAPEAWLQDQINGIVQRLVTAKKRADVEVLFEKKTAEELSNLVEAVKAAEPIITEEALGQ